MLQSTRRSALLAGAVAPLVFGLGWVAGALAQDHYLYRREHGSDLAALDARYPWIMVAAFVVTGLLVLVFAWAFRAAMPRSRAMTVGVVLLVIMGIGLIASGIFREDCAEGLPECAVRVEAGDVSGHHKAHDQLAIPVFLSLIVLPLLLAAKLHREPSWRLYALYSLVSSAAVLVLIVLFGGEVFPAWNGIVQQVLVTVAFGWLLITGILLYRRFPALAASRVSS